MPEHDAVALPSLSADLELLRTHAAQASKIALKHFRRGADLGVAFKNGSSPVSDGDLAVDAYLGEALRYARPDYGWLSEETDDTDIDHRLNAPRTFVVDPIDGTRAYVDGRETWCISLAVVEDGIPIVGVLACPVLDEVWHAARGQGAWCNDLRLPVSDPFPAKTIAGHKTLVSAMQGQGGRAFSHHGYIPSLAYRIAMVAAGRLGGTFIRSGAHDWDIAGAMVLMSETNHLLWDPYRRSVRVNDRDPQKPSMIAAHPELIDEMFAVAG